MKRICAITSLAIVSALVASPAAVAWDQYPFDEYIQRSDTVTLGAGDAPQSNIVTQTIDPWPRNVGNNRIPGNGARMTGAIERYEDPVKLLRAPRPIRPIFDVQSGGASGGGGGGGGGGAAGGQ